MEKKNFEKIEKTYKIELEKKEKKIKNLENKIEILNKNIINKLYLINNNNSTKNKTNINYNQDNTTNMNISTKKISKNEENNSCNSNISKKKLNFNALNGNINLKTMKNSRKNEIYYNINDNISLFYKYLNNEKNSKVRKSLGKNNSASNLYSYNSNINNSTYINKKLFLKNYLNKIKNLKHEGKEVKEGNIKYLSNRNELNNVPKDNSNNDLNSSMKNNLTKLPYNITNNTINMNNNDVMINFNTSIIGGEVDNLKIETKKVKQKLAEYQKMLDMRMDELIKDKKYKISKKQKTFKSCDDFNKISSPKEQIFKKISKVSNHGRNKKSYDNLYSTNYRNISNDNIRSIQQKITIYNPLLNRDSISNKYKNYGNNNSNMKGKIYLDSYNEMMNKKNVY